VTVVGQEVDLEAEKKAAEQKAAEQKAAEAAASLLEEAEAQAASSKASGSKSAKQKRKKKKKPSKDGGQPGGPTGGPGEPADYKETPSEVGITMIPHEKLMLVGALEGRRSVSAAWTMFEGPFEYCMFGVMEASIVRFLRLWPLSWRRPRLTMRAWVDQGRG
jgi:hypothetical protein